LIQIKHFPVFFWTDLASYFNCPMGNCWLAKITALLWIASAIVGCDRAERPPDDTTRHYETRGIVRGLAPDRRTIGIEHQDIRGFMPSMTMPLSARNPKEILDLKIGNGISFRLNVTDEDVWIDNVRKIPASEVHLPPPKPSPARTASSSARLREGDQMPQFHLTDQTRHRVTLESFRGEPFVLTFVFTRCPLPTFCPRMSHNFSELQSAIKSDNDRLGKTRLLSITLDPAFDTPEILSKYAQYQDAEPQIWTFATGDPAAIDVLTSAFSVYVQPEGGTISHGLATALIGPAGKIIRIWRGNGWTPAEVIDQIRNTFQ
jgi:protein SCO1/2